MKFNFNFFLSLMMLTMLMGCHPTYHPVDYELFQNTPIWELAKAVRSNDTTKIRHLVVEKGLDVNYREPVYGYTVMMTALQNGRAHFHRCKTETIEMLLRLGADPNLYSNSSRGENSVLIACDQNLPESLRMLLKYGGNPNSALQREGRWANDNTALIAAVTTFNNGQDTRAIRLLLESGADINGKSPCRQRTAIEAAMGRMKLKVAFLLLRRGADYTGPFHFLSCVDENGKMKDITILECLRFSTPESGSENYYYKKEIIDFLKDRGLDYYSTPIPESIVKRAKEKYPDSWEEYLRVY